MRDDASICTSLGLVCCAAGAAIAGTRVWLRHRHSVRQLNTPHPLDAAQVAQISAQERAQPFGAQLAAHAQERKGVGVGRRRVLHVEGRGERQPLLVGLRERLLHRGTNLVIDRVQAVHKIGREGRFRLNRNGSTLLAYERGAHAKQRVTQAGGCVSIGSGNGTSRRANFNSASARLCRASASAAASTSALSRAISSSSSFAIA
eukprot:scaffold1381_cov111-Isochrysis_galbana.AAC.4